MKTIDASKPVLVTGGSGYLASWIIKQLLDEGKRVHTTLRDLENRNKYAHLIKLAEHSNGQLKFFEADLLKTGSFAEAMDNCELVIHTASPFKITGLKDSVRELVEPALEGTRNVLETANHTTSVKRIVLTSSVVAVYGDAIDILTTKNGRFTAEDWNFTSSARHQPYSFSKTLAEKLAWEMAQAQNRWDLITINPGFIFGPSLSKRTDSTSIEMMIQLAKGKFRTGVPPGIMGFADVRDVAKAHILAGFTTTAVAGRYICVSEHRTYLDMARAVRNKYPDYPLPGGYVPKWLFWLIAPAIGFSRKFVARNIGFDVWFDNSPIKNNFGFEFIPFEKTMTDHFEQLINDNIIQRK